MNRTCQMQLMPVRLSFINPRHKPTCDAQNENRKKRNTVQLIKGSYFPSTYWTDLLQIPGPNSIRSSTLKRKNVKNPLDMKKIKPKKTAQGQFSGCFLETGSTRCDERFRGRRLPALSAFCCVTFHRHRLQEIKLSIPSSGEKTENSAKHTHCP